MIRSARFTLPLLALAWCAPVYGGEDFATPKETPAPAVESTPFKLSGEFETDAAYVSGAEVRRNGKRSDFDEQNYELKLILTPKIPLGYLRVGVEWDRYSFGLGDRSPLPNTLQSLGFILGLDTKFSDSFLIRIEAQPGYYGTFFDHPSGKDFNIPFLIGGTYLYSDDFQIIAGVSVNFERKYPVIPAVGFRWKFAPRLVLNATLPTPRLEYEYNHALTFYIGAELKEDSYRVDEHYGDSHRLRGLNNALVTYSEVRAGGGLNLKLTPTLTLSGEVGCQVAREFDFFRSDVRYHTDGNAPYGSISLGGSF